MDIDELMKAVEEDQKKLRVVLMKNGYDVRIAKDDFMSFFSMNRADLDAIDQLSKEPNDACL